MMIEKLKVKEYYDNGVCMITECSASNSELFKKVNEIIDTVNSIVSVQEKLIDSRFVVEMKHEEPADPYAEQRKWIGKLCRFWQCDIENAVYDILEEINENEEEPFLSKRLASI